MTDMSAHGDVPRILQHTVDAYVAAGHWGNRTHADLVDELTGRMPSGVAYSDGIRSTSWADYRALSCSVADSLQSLAFAREDRVAVFLPDGVGVHAALSACARSGLIAVGIGPRCGSAELSHLISKTGARALITAPSMRDRTWDELQRDVAVRGNELEAVVVVSDDGGIRVHAQAPAVGARSAAEPFGPHDVSMLNSTSGTTGLPKVVTQFDSRWLHFVDLVIDAGDLTSDDSVLSVVPAPYGFGLWSAHYLGVVLGVKTVVTPKFDAAQLCALIERERPTVLCCVATQLRILMAHPAFDRADLSSLRVVFTGGEIVGEQTARRFEERAGAKVLQFYGSNETGAVSGTTVRDSDHRRLSTCGKVLGHMNFRLVEADTTETAVTDTGRPAVTGPVTCAGYFQDEQANAELYAPDGSMLMGDIVRVDDDGYLNVVGRTSDIVIRGGKNISVLEVEAEVEAHPAIAMVVVVPVRDPVFGERVCAVATLHPGFDLALDSLIDFLRGEGFSPEWYPEYLLVVDEFPQSAGAKVERRRVRELAENTVDRARSRL